MKTGSASGASGVRSSKLQKKTEFHWYRKEHVCVGTVCDFFDTFRTVIAKLYHYRIDKRFVEECESWRLESRFFASKVGGKPAWLDLKNLPNSDDLKCKVCDKPCIFLCQIYAPYEHDPRAFHRTLYVFVCTDEACCTPNNNGNLKVLRCQLPRKNPFYPFEPPEEVEHWRSDIRAEKWTKTCRVCGISAPKHCAKCKRVNYCCRDHQVGDWKATHKETCCQASTKPSDVSAKTESSSYALYPEFELVMESESSNDPDDGKDDLAKEAEELERFEALVKSGKAGTLQSEEEIDGDLRSMSKAESDETFTAFSERVKENPDQVLRYERGGTPLFISSAGRPASVPNCEECGGPRNFEFQIMPQLLNYLGIKDVLRSVDWGTLVIYTCESSCPPKSGYIAEYIWKQDIV